MFLLELITMCTARELVLVSTMMRQFAAPFMTRFKFDFADNARTELALV